MSRKNPSTDWKVQKVMDLTAEIFSDTSVSQQKTKDKLTTIKEEIEIRLEALGT